MYKMIHKAIRLSCLIFMVFPTLVLFGIAWYAVFPISVLVMVAISENEEEFIDTLKDNYVTIPRDVLKEILS